VLRWGGGKGAWRRLGLLGEGLVGRWWGDGGVQYGLEMLGISWDTVLEFVFVWIQREAGWENCSWEISYPLRV